jgi:hypothetical protein
MVVCLSVCSRSRPARGCRCARNAGAPLPCSRRHFSAPPQHRQKWIPKVEHGRRGRSQCPAARAPSRTKCILLGRVTRLFSESRDPSMRWALQELSGLPTTGVADPATWSLLLKEGGVEGAAPPATAAAAELAAGKGARSEAAGGAGGGWRELFHEELAVEVETGDGLEVVRDEVVTEGKVGSGPKRGMGGGGDFGTNSEGGQGTPITETNRIRLVPIRQLRTGSLFR